MKKETSITKRTEVDMALLPVIKNLAALGRSEADIGMIIGYSGREPEKFMKQLAKVCPEIKDALEAGRALADTELVTTAFEAATGYDYDEETKEYIYEDELDNDGNPTGKRLKVLNKVRKHKKHTRPDASILKMLLLSRLPDYFIDSKKMVLNIGDTEPTENEMERFFGKMFEVAKKMKTKKIECVEVESDNG